MDNNDVDMLVPGREEEKLRVNLHTKEVKFAIAKIGITQTVLGVTLIIGGIIIICSWPNIGIDYFGEGIWCGVFVLFSGPLSIATYFYLHIALVITCLIMNMLSAMLLLVGMTMAAISTFENSFAAMHMPYATEWSVVFVALNMVLVSCFSLSIYMSIIYIKILIQRRENFCDCYKQDSRLNYTMVYVPSSANYPEPAKNFVPGSLDATSFPKAFARDTLSTPGTSSIN